MSTDLLQARPKVRPQVVLGAAQQRGPARFHLVKRLDDGQSFEVGAKEHFIMSRLDGRRSLAEIGADYHATFDRGLGPANWGQILTALHQRDLLDGASFAARRPDSEPPRSRRPGRHRRQSRSMLAGSVRLLPEPTPVVDRWQRRLRWAFSAWLVVPSFLILLLATGLLVGHIGALAADAVGALTDVTAMLVISAMTWLTAALHELAHGVAARRYGVSVVEIGLRWRLPLVLLYCRVDDYVYLRSRRQQVVIASAGVLVNLMLMVPALAGWWLLEPGPFRDALAALVLVDAVVALVNLLPGPPLDGYRMLSHAVGMADYARQTALFAVLAVRSPAARRAYPPAAQRAYAGYAACAVLALLGLLGGLVVLGHRITGGWLWPSVAVGALVLLNLLGGVYGARRRSGRATAGAEDGTARIPRTGPEVSRVDGPIDAGPAIVLTEVRKRYGRSRAVDGISLEVRRGEFLGLLGPNGAGKTTLVEIAVGLRRPDAGQVRILGASPWPRDLALLPRIGVQTQSAAFFVRHTAREHLRAVAGLYGLDRPAAERALRMVGLTDLAEVRVERLSGGQRQRLAIAAALVHDPEVIFLDEPTAALDPEARRALWVVLRGLHTAGRTIVYTTHHMDEAEALCDRVALVDRGRIVALDTPARLIASAGGTTRLAVPRDRLSLEQARSLPGVSAAYVEGGAVVLEAPDSTTVLTHLSAVTGLHGVQTRSATLEDVYLDLIGREHAA